MKTNLLSVVVVLMILTAIYALMSHSTTFLIVFYIQVGLIITVFIFTIVSEVNKIIKYNRNHKNKTTLKNK